MIGRWRGVGSRQLLLLLLLAAGYILLLRWRTWLGIRPMVEGSLGVVLGLYICSRPASNAVDLLFYRRGMLRQTVANTSGVAWLGLNLLALLAGWLVIVLGAIRCAAAGLGTP